MKWILFLLLIWHQSEAQSIEVIVPKVPVTIGNAFQVQIVLPATAAVEHVDPPVTDSLKMVSGPNIYKGSRMMDGREQAIQNVAFTMVASALGRVRVKGTTIQFRNGTTGRTQDLFIQVIPPVKASFNTSSSYTDLSLYAPSSKKELQELIDENLFVRANVNRTNVFVGEAVVATYKLYSRLQSSSEVVNAPSLYGFSVVDILNTNEAHGAVETIGNKVFNTSVLRKLQLYPDQAGTLVVDPMELENEIEFADPSTGTKKTVVRRAISSQPVVVHVKALPGSAPPDYSDAVGQFSISWKVRQNNIKTSEPGVLIITVKGKGNFVQMAGPELQWPDGFDVFDPRIEDRLNKTATPIVGSRDYVYQFTVDQEGSYKLPPARFSYFDPVRTSFVSIATDSLELKVVGGSSLANGESKNPERAKGKDRWLLPLIALVMLASGMLYFYAKRKKAPVVVQPVEPKARLSERFSALDLESLTDKEACRQIQKILRELKSASMLTPSQHTRLSELDAACQLLAYSPVENREEKERLGSSALSLVQEVENNNEAVN